MAAAMVVGAVFAIAQTPAPQQPTFRTEANYVRVDAYPTRNGEPVPDLAREDFEILEGGQRQAIEQFERVEVRGSTPEAARIEPNNIRESRAMAESSRGRLFVVFLDTYHVDVAGSQRIRQPLTTALDRLIGVDDLVAFMTPEMSARDISFARKTTTIEGMLTRYWPWGQRDAMNLRDAQDQQYGICYPNRMRDPNGPDCTDQNGVAAEMIDRRHEKLSIDSLRDLVRYLRGVREERKAIIAVTNGWLLYRPNLGLMRALNCQPLPTGARIGVDPRNGQPTTRTLPNSVGPDPCGVDRINLAQIDNDHEYQEILDEANRANASFYPIDPRGLAVFDTPIMRQDVPGAPAPVTPPSVDRAMLGARLTSLRTIAEATDGLAMVNSNDLNRSFQRIVADLSAYYLLGYYSNGKLDGKFHAITVKVKRPGIQVRARRGYLAASSAPVDTAAIESPAAAVDAEAAAISRAIGPLSDYAREVPLRLQAAAGWKPGSPSSASVWLVGEIGGVALLDDAWKGGGVAEIQLLGGAGSPVATARATVPAGARTFRVALVPESPLTPGEYRIRIGARAGAATIPSRESLRFSLLEAPTAAGAIWVRRGPATANRETPTADLRFRRNETIRVEIPTAGEGTSTARLLDRNGKALAVPVTSGKRDDPDGSRWITAQLGLAALAPADYVIEIADGDSRMLTAFRLVP